jgi:hypothetical protein
MKQLLGGILIAVGILIAGASGLCSLYMVFASDTFRDGGGMGEMLSMVPLILLFGGPPFAIGVAIAFGGRSLIRQARREREPTDGDVTKTFE